MSANLINLKYILGLFLLCSFIFLLESRAEGAEQTTVNAYDIVYKAFDYMRDKASVSTVEMVIKRPDWERKMTLKAKTVGEENSVFRILDPPKDKGNGTLKIGNQMWTFNPKVNRVVRLPPSMMAQSWMGSDFSNNDLAKTDSIIKDYIHSLKTVKKMENHTVYVIESIPKADAPVIWGKQEQEIRDDHIFLKQTFFDEEMLPVKILTFSDIKMMGGKLYPSQMKMRKAEVEDEYTLVDYKEIQFLDRLPDNLFTITALKRLD